MAQLNCLNAGIYIFYSFIEIVPRRPENTSEQIISRLTKHLRNGDTLPTKSHAKRIAMRTLKASKTAELLSRFRICCPTFQGYLSPKFQPSETLTLECNLKRTQFVQSCPVGY